LSASTLTNLQQAEVLAQSHVTGMPRPANRQQRRQQARLDEVPVLHGGQRWKCINALCGDMPTNVAPGVPKGFTFTNPVSGKVSILCTKCWERVSGVIMSLVPILAPFDPSSEKTHEDQLRLMRETNIEELEAKYREMVEKGEAPMGDDLKERAEASGIELAR
jgi:hypothetical protein